MILIIFIVSITDLTDGDTTLVIEIMIGENLITHYMPKNGLLMICMPQEHQQIMKQQQRSRRNLLMIKDFDEIMIFYFDLSAFYKLYFSIRKYLIFNFNFRNLKK